MIFRSDKIIASSETDSMCYISIFEYDICHIYLIIEVTTPLGLILLKIIGLLKKAFSV